MSYYYAGAAAGATLGWIHGNIKGSYLGYRIGKNLPRYNMPPVKRKAWTPQTPRKTPKKQYHAKARYSKARRPTRGFNSRLRPYQTTGRKRTYKERKPNRWDKKPIKTVGQVKKIVQKELNNDMPIGKYVTYNGGIMRHEATGNTYSTLQNLINANTTGNSRDFALFSPKYVLDRVSVMFNGKTPNFNWSLTTGNIAGLPEVHVVNQYVMCNLYNNSQRDYTVQIYEITPKDKLADVIEDFSVEFNANIDDSNSPFKANDYAYSPESYETVRAKYTVKVTSINLPPQGRQEHSVQGKRGLYDFDKIGQIDQYPGYTKYIWYRIRHRFGGGLSAGLTTPAANGHSGTYPAGDLAGTGVHVKHVHRSTIRAPEGYSFKSNQWKQLMGISGDFDESQTFFQNPVASVIKPN